MLERELLSCESPLDTDVEDIESACDHTEDEEAEEAEAEAEAEGEGVDASRDSECCSERSALDTSSGESGGDMLCSSDAALPLRCAFGCSSMIV